MLSSHTKSEVVSSAATWMDPETVTLNEADETQKDKPHTVLLTAESKTKVPKNLFTKQRQSRRNRHRKQSYG